MRSMAGTGMRAAAATVLGGAVPAAALVAWREATAARVSIERVLFGDGAVISWLTPAAARTLRDRSGEDREAGGYLVHQRHEAGANKRVVRRLALEPLSSASGHLAAILVHQQGVTAVAGTPTTRLLVGAPRRDEQFTAHEVLHVAAAVPDVEGVIASAGVDDLERQRLASYASLAQPLVLWAGAGVALAGALVGRTRRPIGAWPAAGAALVGLGARPALTGLLRRLAPPRPAAVDLGGAGFCGEAGASDPGARWLAGGWVVAVAGAVAAGSRWSSHRKGAGPSAPGGRKGAGPSAPGGRKGAGPSAPHGPGPAVAAGAVAVALAAVDIWLAATVRTFAGAYDGFGSMAGATAAPYRDTPLTAGDEAAVRALAGDGTYRNRFRFVSVAGTLALVSGVDPALFPQLRYRYRVHPTGDRYPGPGQAVVSSSLQRRIRRRGGDRQVPLTIAGPDGPCEPEIVGVIDDPTWMAGIVVLDIADVERTFGAAGSSTLLTRHPLDAGAAPGGRHVVIEPVAVLQRDVTRAVAIARVPLLAGATGALALAASARAPRPDASVPAAAGALAAAAIGFATTYLLTARVVGLGAPRPSGPAVAAELTALAGAVGALAGLPAPERP